MPPSSTKGDVVLRLLDGRSEQRELVLGGGRARPPFALGRRGGWRIDAGHVAEAHVMLAFNGSNLYVCASRGEKALLDGVPLDGQWRQASTPSELRFGSARMSIGRRAGPEEETQLPNSEATRIADVSVPEPRSRREDEATCFDPERLRAALALSRQDDDVTRIAELTRFVIPDGVEAPVPPKAASVRSVEMPPFPRPAIRTIRMPPFVPPVVSPPATVHTSPVAVEVEAPEERASSMPPTIPSDGLIPVPFTPYQVPFKVAASRPSAPTMAIALPSDGSTGEAGYDSSPPHAFDSIDGIERSALAFSGETSSTPSGAMVDSTAVKRGRLAELAHGWKRASIAKRAIAILMVPALIGALFTMRPTSQARAESEVVSAPAATDAKVAATPQATASPTVRPVAIASAIPIASATPVAGATATAPRAKADTAGLRDTWTAERKALDTVASGLDTSAAEQYEVLAGAHPDNLAFREAARILRERAATTGQHD